MDGQILEQLIATGGLTGLLGFIVYHQSKKVARLEQEVRDLYERVVKLFSDATNLGDSSEE